MNTLHSKTLNKEIKVEFHHRGLGVGGDWIHDIWKVHFSDEVGRVNYKTGIGHRKLKPAHNRSYYNKRVGVFDKGRNKSIIADAHKFRDPEEAMKYLTVDTTISIPDIDDVLHSLTMDYSAMEMSFEEWAKECEYSSDSLKARDIYSICQNNSIKLQKIAAQIEMSIEEILTAFQNY